ncbi:MAG: hypothetical protein P3B98_10200 [Gemmatimonadota bacterium]|nr:hypothetical protein [Gemmatimonadota bacterium]
MARRAGGFVAGVVVAVAGACASSGAAGSAAAPSGPTVSTAITLKGSFSSVLQSTASLGMANKIRVDGSVTLVSAGAGNAKTRVRLMINFPVSNEQLPWAIVPGNCGNGAIAVMAVSKFGAIDVGPSGRGTLEADLAIALTPGEPYHVEVYRSGQALSDVIACTNLRKGD